MSMIEKAARALAGWTPNVTCWEDIGEKRGDGEKLQAIYRQRVRAVIEALMEPTPGMLQAGTQAYAFRTYQSFTTEDEAARDILLASLTAALNEGEG